VPPVVSAPKTVFAVQLNGDSPSAVSAVPEEPPLFTLPLAPPPAVTVRWPDPLRAQVSLPLSARLAAVMKS